MQKNGNYAFGKAREKKMKIIEIKGDFRPLKRAIRQILLFGKSKPPKNILNLFLKFFDKRGCLRNKLCSIKNLPTRRGRAGELWVSVEPSAQLGKLVATIRAYNRKRKGGKHDFHCLAPYQQG
jgi:hypothetical protein